MDLETMDISSLQYGLYDFCGLRVLANQCLLCPVIDDKGGIKPCSYSSINRISVSFPS